MHADFGSGRYQGAPIGIPFVTVRGSQRNVPVSFEYADESDRGRYPIPPRVPIEGGGHRRRPPRDRGRPLALPPLRAVRRLSARRRQALGAPVGRDLRPALEPPAPARLDVGRRRRPADPAWARALRRGEARPHRPRPAIHGGAPGARTCTRRATSPRTHRSRPSRDGPAAAAAGEIRHLALPAPVARGAEGAQALRDDPRRQRLVLVRDRAPSHGWDNDDLHSLGRVPGSVRGGGHSRCPARRRIPRAHGYHRDCGCLRPRSRGDVVRVRGRRRDRGRAARADRCRGCGLPDVGRRHQNARSIQAHREEAKTDKVDFSARDRQTLFTD